MIRGRDPTRELAEALAARVGKTRRRLLRKGRWTRAQVSLPRGARRRNLKDAFQVTTNREMPERVLLVDDVLTTGTTASECARVLKAAGVQEVFVLAAARSGGDGR
jgi:predicted amidophosphoribosyltransferase